MAALQELEAQMVTKTEFITLANQFIASGASKGVTVPVAAWVAALTVAEGALPETSSKTAFLQRNALVTLNAASSYNADIRAFAAAAVLPFVGADSFGANFVSCSSKPSHMATATIPTTIASDARDNEDPHFNALLRTLASSSHFGKGVSRPLQAWFAARDSGSEETMKLEVDAYNALASALSHSQELRAYFDGKYVFAERALEAVRDDVTISILGSLNPSELIEISVEGRDVPEAQPAKTPFTHATVVKKSRNSVTYSLRNMWSRVRTQAK
ncbi:hypothetical protein BC830DRAFT_1174152 [Chytriomyces sp. MP71]|nr:hypothetical protein BC830DRAFT_1174152 [Chytriomyces sp. MP71]